MRRWIILLGIVVVVIYAMSAVGRENGNGNTNTSGNDERLARSMCSDLEDGLSMFQMHSQAVGFYRDQGRSDDAAQLAAAQLEDLATREYCPAFRDDFEATIAYEQWIE